MPSTYTLNNGIELIGTGEQSGTWGDTTNTNLELLDTALDGQVTVTLSSTGSGGSPNTLPISDGSSSNGRNRLVVFNDGSDIGGTVYVQLTPNDAEKIIYVRNSLSGSRSILLFQGTYNASNDYEIPAGTTAIVFFNGGGTGAVAANVFNNAYFDGLRLGSVSVDKILDEDNMASNDAAALATQQSIKAYVDSQVTAQDLDFGGDSGTGAVDLDSQTFTVAGTSNEIETSASGQTLTIGLPDDVTIAGDLTVDTDTLYVDSTNNRVGINKDAPSVPLHIDIGTDNNAIYIESSDQFANIGLVDGGGSGKIIMDGGDLLLTSGGDATTSFTGSVEAMRVDSSQRVLINTTTSRVVGGSAEAVTQIYNTSNGALLSLFRDQASNNGGAIIRGGKARNGAIVQDNDTIFSLEAVAHDGTDMGSFAGTIAFLVDGTPGANDTPSRIAFYTTADGSSSGTERMRINNVGNVAIGAHNPSEKLHVAAAAINSDVARFTGANTDRGLVISTAVSGSTNDSVIIYNADTSTGQHTFEINGTEAMRIDSSQRVLIGDDSSVGVNGFDSKFQVTHSGYATASLTVYRNGSDGAGLNFAHSRSGTVGTNTILQDGDALGHIYFTGADGTDFASRGADISARVDGTPGSNYMPGRIVFATTADGASSSTERMRIDSDGLLTASYNILINNNADSTLFLGKGKESADGVVKIKAVQTGGDTDQLGISFYTHPSASGSASTEEAGRFTAPGQFIVGGGYTYVQNWYGQSGINDRQINAYNQGGNAAVTVVAASTSTVQSGQINLGKMGTSDLSAFAILDDDEDIGRISFQGADGTYLQEAAYIKVDVDGTPGAADMPGRIEFGTTADGAATPTERMRIDSTGRTFVGNLGYIGTATTNSVFEAHGGSVVFGSSNESNNQGYRTFVRFFQVNNSSSLPTSANLDLLGMTSEFYCKITIVGVNPYAGSNAFTYINESTGYAGGNFSVISANEYGNGSGISFGTATLYNPSGTDYRVRIPVTSSYTGYRFVATAEIIGISKQDNPRFAYS